MAELGKNENAINDEELDAVSGGKKLVVATVNKVNKYESRVSLTSKEGEYPGLEAGNPKKANIYIR